MPVLTECDIDVSVINSKIDLIDKTAVLIYGSVKCNGVIIEAPAVLSNETYSISNESRIFSPDELS